MSCGNDLNKKKKMGKEDNRGRVRFTAGTREEREGGHGLADCQKGVKEGRASSCKQKP